MCLERFHACPHCHQLVNYPILSLSSVQAAQSLEESPTATPVGKVDHGFSFSQSDNPLQILRHIKQTTQVIILRQLLDRADIQNEVHTVSPKRNNEDWILIKTELMRVSAFGCVVHTDIKDHIYRSRVKVKTARRMAKHSIPKNIGKQARPFVLT